MHGPLASIHNFPQFLQCSVRMIITNFSDNSNCFCKNSEILLSAFICFCKTHLNESNMIQTSADFELGAVRDFESQVEKSLEKPPGNCYSKKERCAKAALLTTHPLECTQ